MSTIRERQADQSHMLLGRTRAERLLDGIYQRQKRYLLQRRRRAAAEAAHRIVLPEEKRRRLLDVIPEPAVTGDAAGAAVPAGRRQRVKQQTRGGAAGATAKEKNVEDAVEALQRHLWRHAKFDKAVQLLHQLWQSHLVPETKRCLLAGLLTAASTDNCISSPTGRTEVAALFRNVVEPVLQRECDRRRQAELKEQQERLERTKLRAVLFNDRLQSAVMNERRTPRATNALRPVGSAVTVCGRDAAAGGRVRPDGTDAGTRATVAAVAAAAAAAVDREEQKYQHHPARSCKEACTLQEGRSSTDRAGRSAAPTGSGATAAASRSSDGGNSTARIDTEADLAQENPHRAQSEEAGGKSELESEGIRLDDAEKKLLEILQLRCKTHLLLFTDDAFQFNQQVAELRRVFDGMLHDVQAEDEPDLSDEEAARHADSVQRETGEGSCDAGDDYQLAAVNKGTAKKGVSSLSASADGIAVLSTTTALKGPAVSAAHTAQQPKAENQHLRELKQRQSLEALNSGSFNAKYRGETDKKDQAQVASLPVDKAAASESTAGMPSAAADAASSAGAAPAAAGAQKTGNATTGREEAGAAGIEQAGNTATASQVRAHAETFDANGNGVQSNATGVLPSEDAASYAAPTGSDAEEDEEMPPTPEERWPLPLKKGELRNLLRCFFMDCLASLFAYRSTTWARAAIEQLFQHVYLNRFVFDESDRGQIGLWQAQLKAPTKASANVSALRIGEAPVPVQDGRDERISTIHGSMVWSAKQMGA